MTKREAHSGIRPNALILLAWAFFTQAAWAQGSPVRIVVLPFYTEGGVGVTDGGYEEGHYRRLSQHINGQLVRGGFEVVEPSAHGYTEPDYHRLRAQFHEDSAVAAMKLTRRFRADAAYLVWFDVDRRKTWGGGCTANARVVGEGYAGGTPDPGVGLRETFAAAAGDCDGAVVEVERLAGDEVGRRLTAWAGRRTEGGESSAVISSRRGEFESSNTVTSDWSTGASSDTGGVVAGNVELLRKGVSVRLEEVTTHGLVEVFGKVLDTAPGVVEMKTGRFLVRSGNPKASFATWRVRIENTTLDRLATDIMEMLEEVSAACGELVLEGVEYRYSAAEIDLLTGIYPIDMAPHAIVFVVDRERARRSCKPAGYGGAGGKAPEPPPKTPEPPPKTPEPPPKAPEPPPIPAKKIEYELTEEVSIDIPIYFEFDSDQVSERSRAQVGEIAQALTAPALRRARIRIEGHTDERGSSEYNLDLSRRRAASVERMLIEKYGIAGARLETQGFGESQPVDHRHNEAAWAANRRVTFVNLGSR